jgi:hypothetical protein
MLARSVRDSSSAAVKCFVTSPAVRCEYRLRGLGSRHRRPKTQKKCAAKVCERRHFVPSSELLRPCLVAMIMEWRQTTGSMPQPHRGRHDIGRLLGPRPVLVYGTPVCDLAFVLRLRAACAQAAFRAPPAVASGLQRQRILHMVAQTRGYALFSSR